MFEIENNRKKVQRAIIVGIQTQKMTIHESELLLEELEELVTNLDIPVLEKRIVRLRKENPATLIGKGKVEELIALAKEVDADVIVFDDELSPAQQRNWEHLSKLCVIDRQEVILDIFSERAQTREAVLQVALARMEYSLPRLTRAWTHLSRQRGGGTGARGQGETQLEADRRLVNQRITRLKDELKDVIKQRDTQRSKRLRRPIPTAAIVGYTNAGKSSLLNALTDADALAEDKLFATLDPTTKRLKLDNSQSILITDTVGFVRRLPHRLVEAFKATLEEAIVSDVLIHVVDINNPEIDAHFETTMEVMNEIGAGDKNAITVFNKIDQCVGTELIEQIKLQYKNVIFVSAKTGEGLEELKLTLSDQLNAQLKSVEILIPHDRYDVISKLHDCGGIRSQKAEEDGIHIEGIFPQSLSGLFGEFIK